MGSKYKRMVGGTRGVVHQGYRCGHERRCTVTGQVLES